MEIPEDRTKLPGFARAFIEGYLALLMTLDLPKSAGELAETALTSFVRKDAAVDGSSAILVRELQPALQEADRMAEQRIAAGKKVLQLKLGERWTLAHKEAGYSHGTLEMPKSLKGRARLLNKMGELLIKNAHWENKDLEVTGALFLASAEALSKAVAAVEAHGVVHKGLVKERDDAARQLRHRLRTLKSEVSQVLSKDDLRWGTLGVESPAEARAKRGARAQQKKLAAEANGPKVPAEKLEAAHRTLEAARIKFEKARALAERSEIAASAAKKRAVTAGDAVARLEAAYLALGGVVPLTSNETRGLSVTSEDSALVA